MIFECEECVNRANCPEKQDGYKKLCRLVEAVDKVCYPIAYYNLTLKCDYWVEDKEVTKRIFSTPTEKGGE